MDNSKTSICYMSLADAFLTRLKKEVELRTRSRMQKGVSVEVLPITSERHDFMYDHLTNLYNNKKGTFNKPKIFAKATIYECERSNPCKGSSSGDPTKTRANGCNAYVSFVFEEGATITACVIRSRLQHTGHDPTNRDESRVSRIDPSLKFLIEVQINKGMKIGKIMTEIAKWNKLHKNTDHHNRRYFPTRQDIHQLVLSLKKPTKPLIGIKFDNPRRLRKCDSVKHESLSKDNVSHLLRMELRDSCVYHQTRTTTGPNPRPLVVVLQNSEMRETIMMHGRHVVFIEKNYEGLRQYGNAVYVLVARDKTGDGEGPVAYIVTSDDEPVSFIQGLQKLSEKCEVWPRVFVLDGEIHGFSEVMSVVFPESLFLTSWCQMIQEVHRWLQSSQVSGKEHAEIRRIILHSVLELRAHDTEGWFLLAANEIQERIEYEQFHAMFHSEWLSCGAKWSDFGRNDICGSQEYNYAMEMSFLRINHQHLKGLHTMTCLEDLLRLITDNMNYHKKNEGQMVPNPSEGPPREEAEALVRQGWGQLVTWHGVWVALVPCNTTPDTNYRANVITMECECPRLASEGPCLHLSLALVLIQSRDGPTPVQERHRLASEAYENSDYLLDGGFCLTFHSGGLCVSEIGVGKCTCVADVFGVECVGKILLKIAEGAEEAVTYTVPDQITDFANVLDPEVVVKETEGLLCVPLNSDKSLQSITINVLSDEGATVDSERSHKDKQEPIVIQNYTGVESIHVVEMDDSITSNIKQEEMDNSNSLKATTKSNITTQNLIEELYHWSKSEDYVDCKPLRDLISEAHTLALCRQETTLEPHKINTAKVKKPKIVGNKKLRATIRPIKRVRRVSGDEEELGREYRRHSTKVSRSGRTIKIKEEPDFVL